AAPNNQIRYKILGAKSGYGNGVRRFITVLKGAYAELDRDRETIRKYLNTKGIKDANIVFSAVGINKEFQTIYDSEMNVKEQRFAGYLLDQSVTIESKEVDKVEDISRQVSELINSGVEFYSQDPQYYYTKLSELKIEMIAQATKDANERAKKIAENAGSSVGSLKNANMGVFQIVAQNSSEDFSWGGSFNTSSKRKTANITVKLEYEVD
ncbi:MAG: SIMPL domain-containing protein, partial [Bacteroidota bacterium]